MRRVERLVAGVITELAQFTIAPSTHAPGRQERASVIVAAAIAWTPPSASATGGVERAGRGAITELTARVHSPAADAPVVVSAQV